MTMEGLQVADAGLVETSAPMHWHVAVDAQSETPGPPFQVDGSAATSPGARLVSRRAFARGDAVWPLSGRLTASRTMAR